MRFLRIIALLGCACLSTRVEAGWSWLDELAPGAALHGFRAQAVYLDDADRPVGGRFLHERTGFTLDLLRIQSAPQAFLWVNSFPTSDMGEPHTQEHLLLGKGNRGRFVASLQSMSLSDSNAFTLQTRTCYNFDTTAGAKVFYRLFESQLDALLHPDYTDEEIRREVRNFGVSPNPATGELELEEKGTVYNEMVSTFEKPWTRLDRQARIALYGPKHPLAYVAGGSPSALRELKPENIRAFHDAAYHLGNMGVVVALPDSAAPETALESIARILDRTQPPQEGTQGRKAASLKDLPPPAPVATESVELVEYPSQSDEQPGVMLFAWPATRELTAEDQTLLGLFLANFAGDSSTNLYKLFVDTQTRVLELGTQNVYGWVEAQPGQPVFLALDNVAAEHLTPESALGVRGRIQAELSRLAALDDGAPELAAFNERLRGRIAEQRRSLSHFISSPPGFGARDTGAEWMDHLDLLARGGEFRRSLTLRPELASIERRLADGRNPWRERLAAWKLLDGRPYAAIERPSSRLLKSEAEEKSARLAAETQRLRTFYSENGKTPDAGEALRRYRADSDAETAKLEEIEKKVETPRFLENPPLTLDDGLVYQVETLEGGMPLVAASFEGMSRATVGLDLRLDGATPEQLVYVSLLPELLTGVGFLENGKPISYDEAQERQRREILSLDSSFSTSPTTGRCELELRGAGNTLEEAGKALGWMRLALGQPDWRPENLARLRDLVDQHLAALRATLQQPEEYWVQDPATAYRRQDHLLMLAATSALTREHNALRLRWLLMDAKDPKSQESISGWLEALAGAGAKARREELAAFAEALAAGGDAKQPAASAPASLAPLAEALAGMPDAARELAREAAKDLSRELPSLPGSSLAADWAYLCRQMRADLLVPPASALAELDGLRRKLLKKGNARVFLIGSPEARQKLDAGLRQLLDLLRPEAADPRFPTGAGLIRSRLLGRDASAASPVFVGLVNPDTQSGVLLNSAPLTSYADLDRESLLRFLAAELYAGGGAHGMFMKTWGAGLAYSNGLQASPASGRLSYYAERCPRLEQTLAFVIDTLKAEPRNAALAEYAMSLAFYSRAAQSYEERGAAMAQDLADGRTPELQRRFSEALLKLRQDPGLADEIQDRMREVYARVLPGFGLGPSPGSIEGAVYLAIGPEARLASYEEFLRARVAPEAKVYRLYPRDFWIPRPGLSPP